MTTPTQPIALRLALVALLREPHAPLTTAQRREIESWLFAPRDPGIVWRAEATADMRALALAWAKQQGDATWLTLRKAVGETLTEDEHARLPSHARLGSTRTHLTLTAKECETMSIPQTEVSPIMTPDFDRELAIVTKEFERSPYWFPRKTKPLAEAARLVAAAKVFPQPEVGVYEVQSSKKTQGNQETRYTCHVGQSCTCPDSTQYGESKWCKHLIAVDLYREVQARVRPALFPAPKTVEERLAAQARRAETIQAHLERGLPEPEAADAPAHHAEPSESPQAPAPLTPLPEEGVAQNVALAPEEAAQMAMPGSPAVPATPPAPVAPVKRERPKIPAHYVILIKGKQHIQFAGLVAAAQDYGLVFLAADWTYNDAELSLAHAIAKFDDGRQYEESGDATPSNVTPMVRPHFRRVALTRAKARCLRDALGIEECSVEELEEDGGDRLAPEVTRSPEPVPEPEPDPLLRRIKDLMHALGFTGTTQRQARAQIRAWTDLDLEPQHYQAIVTLLTHRRVHREEYIHD